MKVLSPTSGFSTWEFDKGAGNPQGIWPWRPPGFDYSTSTGLEERETPLLEGTNTISHAPRPKGKEQWPQRRLIQNYLLLLGGSPVEAWDSKGSWQGRGHWQQQSWKVPLDVSPIGLAINLTTEPIDPSPGMPQAKTLTRREYKPTHLQTIELKIYWPRPCPPKQDPGFPTLSFPSESLQKPLSLIHQRACRRSKKKNNGEDARIVYQRPRSTKEQTEMNTTLEEVNSRTTEAEEWIRDLEDRMVEITAVKQNIRKKCKKKKKV